jgi:hypothetical protein
VRTEQRNEDKNKRRRLSAAVNELGNPAGGTWTYEECKLLLCMGNSIMLYEALAQTDALHKLALFSHRSYYTLHHLYSAWREDRVILYHNTSARGGASYTHVNRIHRIPTEIVAAIHILISSHLTTTVSNVPLRRSPIASLRSFN